MIFELFQVNVKWIVRDKILQAIIGVAFLLLLLVPAFSVLSMRQVQELSITLALSSVSLVLFLLSTLLGSSSVWRDVEKRYTSSLISLPYSRSSYLLGKFGAIAFSLISTALILAVMSGAAIKFSAGLYPSASSINWTNVLVAICFDTMKYILLAAIALLLSTFCTSFFLPIFGSVSLLLAGNASQEVFEFITKNAAGSKMSIIIRSAVNLLYYLIPNFSAFDYKVSAIYPVPLNVEGLLYTFLYFIVYTSIVLTISMFIFTRREL